MASKKDKILSPEEILSQLKGETVNINVPEWGENVFVCCKIPDQESLCRLRLKFPDKEKFDHELFKACIVGVDGKKLDEMKSTGNGIKFGQLYKAVMTAADLWGMAVREDEQKK